MLILKVIFNEGQTEFQLLQILRFSSPIPQYLQSSENLFLFCSTGAAGVES